MYSRQFSKEPAPQDVPCGYGGNAFSHPSDIPPASSNPQPEPGCKTESAAEASTCPPSKTNRRFPPFLSRFFDGKWGGFDFKNLLSGDLLLIAVAILLLTGDNDGCEEKDDDLWLLLILLYFMK